MPQAASLWIIPHSQKHLLDVGNANRLFPRSLIFPEHVHLSARDLVALDGILLGEIGAHVLEEAARDRGR
jgi:hypothetical protein